MIKVSRKELASALGLVGKATQSRTTLPVLSCVKLSYDGELTLTATNLATTLVRKLTDAIADVMDDEHFATCVPFDKFKDAVDIDAGREVVLNLKGDTLWVTIGKVNSKIKCLSSDGFPLIDLSTTETVCYIDAELLKKCVERASYAAETDAKQEVFRSVYFDGQSALSVVSASQFGGMSVMDTGVKVESPFTAIVPLESAGLVSALSGKVDIGSSDGRIVFQSPDTTVMSQVVDGKYPLYRSVIPTALSGSVTGETKDLLNALKGVQSYSKEDFNVCVIDVSFEMLSVSSRSTEKGESESAVDAEVNVEGGFQFMCNANLLADAIKHAANRYEMKFRPDRNGAVITSSPYDGWTGVLAFMNPK